MLVCDLIRRCPTIEEIYLQNNLIDNNGGQALAESIRGRKITKLDVDNNRINGRVLAELLTVVPVRKLNLVRN